MKDGVMIIAFQPLITRDLIEALKHHKVGLDVYEEGGRPGLNLPQPDCLPFRWLRPEAFLTREALALPQTSPTSRPVNLANEVKA